MSNNSPHNHNRYNLYDIELRFREFLSSGIKRALSKRTIKNYLSDLRHFFGWLIFYTNSRNTIKNSDTLLLLKTCTNNVLQEYKQYLIDNAISPITINRRLSSLRLFFSYCLSVDILNIDPTVCLKNISIHSIKSHAPTPKQTELFINQYLESIRGNKTKQTNIKKDINEFFSTITKS